MYFIFLSFVPQLVHFIESHIFQVFALLQSFFLYIVESRDEFLVSSFQSIFRVDIVMASEVDERENDISEFSLYIIFITFFDFFGELAHFFINFLPNLLFIVPIETNAMCFFLYSLGFYKSRKCVGHTTEHAFFTTFLL